MSQRVLHIRKSCSTSILSLNRMMHVLRLLFIYTFLLVVTCGRRSVGFKIFGYVPEYRYGAVEWEKVVPYLSHLILFSVEVTPHGNLTKLERLPDPNGPLWKKIQTVAKEHGTKVMVCLGGAGRSNSFGAVLSNDTKREYFVENIVHLLQERNLDGVDLNFEVPRETERQETVHQFLKDLERSLRPLDKTATLAIHPGPRQQLPATVIEHVDFVHLMAYDNWCAFPPHARPPCRHSELEYATRVVQQTISVPHVQSEVITLGIPFYGRHVTTGQVKTYSELVSGNSTLDTSLDELNGYYFNGKTTLKEKIAMAFKNRIGGVMLWELGSDCLPDDPLSLLPYVHKIVEELRSQYRREEEL